MINHPIGPRFVTIRHTTKLNLLEIPSSVSVSALNDWNDFQESTKIYHHSHSPGHHVLRPHQPILLGRHVGCGNGGIRGSGCGKLYESSRLFQDVRDSVGYGSHYFASQLTIKATFKISSVSVVLFKLSNRGLKNNF